jgi:hypothetical protein
LFPESAGGVVQDFGQAVQDFLKDLLKISWEPWRLSDQAGTVFRFVARDVGPGLPVRKVSRISGFPVPVVVSSVLSTLRLA